ncbi:uncharacterized protein [Nicotiana tomentosiformis]|uniref:uncharacterized protein n=1 Tax=Nicotiana tomentosiformis TaxID=4098 RepID=UPI00388C6950
MKIAAETPVRSERDEKIITNLRQKVHDYGFDLTKAERDLLNAQAKLTKSAEEHARLAHQLNQKYDKEVAILQKKLAALENEMSYAQPPPYPQWRAPTPKNPYPPPQPYRNPTGPSFRSRLDYRKERQQRKETFTPLGESYTSLFQRLRQLDVLRLNEPKTPNPPPKNLDYSLRYAYCSDAPGHDTEKCWHLKRFIRTGSESNPVKAPDFAKAMPLTVGGVSEKLSTLNVKPSVLVVKGPPIDVEANQKKQKVIVTYKGKEVEEEVNKTRVLTRSGRCFTPDELRKANPFKDDHIPVKKPVTEEEAEEFLKKMKMQDYSIIANKIFEANRITFSDDELPMEGTEHNRALYFTVKCEDSAVSRVLVDNGSSANICPLSTLQKLKIGTERIHMNNVCVRGFDGGGKDSVGDIMLELSIGPVEFTMEFQVLDVAVSYNLLLGRPWIHAAKAIPSSLHQMVKFEWDRQEIVMHGDENLSAYNDTIVPFIEVEDDKGPWVYQTFETVSVEKIPEGECILGPKLPSASVMVANEMLKNGFVLGKGLGSSLQGIAHPVCPRESFGTFGLGFTLTGKDMKKAKNLKRKAWSSPKPVPHISNSFDAGFNDMTCMRNFQPNLKSQSNSEITIQEVECDDEIEYDEEAAFQEISRELNHFEDKPKPNLNEIEAINLGDQDNIRETKISVHMEQQIREEIIKALFEYKDVFAWSYDDMPGLSTDLVVHKLPTDPAFPPIKQKLRKFKTDMSVKIKEEITKQLGAKVIRVIQYPIWLANVVPVPKKDGNTRVCVDYRDLNKASPKDNFPLPNIHILIDNYAKHEIGSFVDCYVGYHQILMDEEDAEKTAFITPYNLKLNLAKCAFGVPFGKLLGFIASRHGIELDPSKIKAIQELPPPKNKTEVMSLLGRLKYISRFIAQLTTTCEPIFKLLKKNAAVKWTDECQEAFDKIKIYLSNPPVLVSPEPGRPLILYLTILDNSFGCVLGQHDISGKKEQAIYYLSKKFTPYEGQEIFFALPENPHEESIFQISSVLSFQDPLG